MGGANLMLSSFDLFKQINQIFKEAKDQKIIFVLSALEGITRLLDSIFIAMQQKNKAEIDSLFLIFKEIHFKRMKELKIENISRVEEIFLEIDYFIHKEHISGNKTIDQAQLLAFGEILSSAIFHQLLANAIKEEILLVDARSFMVSGAHGSSYVESKINIIPTRENIKCLFSITENKYRIFLTQGFVSTDDESGRCAVLGYDGSDLSAAIIALSLQETGETQLTYWKDVLGVLKDLKYPDIFPVMKINEYLEYSILSSVPVRPDSLRVLQDMNSSFRVYIRSFLKLESLGTIIKP